MLPLNVLNDPSTPVAVSPGRGGSLARRRWQSGSITYRNGNCYGRYRKDVVGTDGKIARKDVWVFLGTQKDLPTERLARKRLAPHLVPINSFTYRPERVTTMLEFIEAWKREVLSQQKPSTQRAARSHLKVHIIPKLGMLRLEEIGTENQQRFIGTMEGMNRKSVTNILSTLSSILTTAKNWGYTTQEVEMKRLRLPQRGIPTEEKYLTTYQIAQILNIVPEPWRTLFMVLGLTGMRPGEVLGLQPQDIDFTAGTIRIARSVWYGTVQTTKTKGSEAVVPMPAMLSAAIVRHIKTLNLAPDAFLFTNSAGKPLSSQKVVEYHLRPALDALNIPRCGLKAFRHGMATMLAEDGVHPSVAQAQLRHSKASTTARYTHPSLALQRTAIEAQEERLRDSLRQLSTNTQFLQ
jgi:integrase